MKLIYEGNITMKEKRKRNFYGSKKKRAYFEGWYLKQQNDTDTISFIPAFHINKNGMKSASLQIVTNDASYHLDFPIEEFGVDVETCSIQIGNSTFGETGCTVDIHHDDVQINGSLQYSAFKKPKYDIMGPFCYVPFMQCIHRVYSLQHFVSGELTLNGKAYVFTKHLGYMEADRGTSFPSEYLWTQCSWGEHSLMVSIANIPFCGLHFRGCIGFIYLDGVEYRFATYLGVRLKVVKEDMIELEQGDIKLRVHRLENRAQPLFAPDNGEMLRTIHESASCTVQYTCWIRNELKFDLVNEQASFESDWHQ